MTSTGEPVNTDSADLTRIIELSGHDPAWSDS
jgi:hypothetical protein